jgi:hypothetical protein
MVDSIFGKNANAPGTVARLKVSAMPPSEINLGLTASEKQLSDIVDIGAVAQKKAQSVRNSMSICVYLTQC